MNSYKTQTGATLIETMISLALSMIVVTSMVILMSNSLGSATKIIEMSQLTDELRNAMSMMTRDVRRANYDAYSYRCYANSDCGVDGSTTAFGDIAIDGDCFTFELDRRHDGNDNTDDAGGFRRTTTGGVGQIEMWVGGDSPNCAANANWLPITDPGFVDVTDFTIDDSDSILGSIEEEGGTLTTRTRRIDLLIDGQLILEPAIQRRIVDTIRVRNDFLN